MRHTAILCAVLVASSAALAAADGGAPKADAPKGAPTAAKPPPAKETAKIDFPSSVKKDDEKTLYILGLTLGRSLSVFSLSKAELEIVKKGIADQISSPSKYPTLQQAVQETYSPKFRDLIQTRSAAKSKTFLDKAAKEKGAEKTASGLIYTLEKEGVGSNPKPTDRVKVNYRGTLTDGTEFDSSYKRGQPAEFPLNGVIPCWTEGVQKMKPGGKAKLVCPANIAYGDRGQPGVIPPGAALTFEVELVSATAAPPAPPPGTPGGAGMSGGAMPPHP